MFEIEKILHHAEKRLSSDFRKERAERVKARIAERSVSNAVCTARGHARSFERRFSRFAKGE